MRASTMKAPPTRRPNRRSPAVEPSGMEELEKSVDERGERRALAEHDQRPEEHQDEHDRTEPPLLSDPHEGPELANQRHNSGTCHPRSLSTVRENCQRFDAVPTDSFSATARSTRWSLSAVAFARPSWTEVGDAEAERFRAGGHRGPVGSFEVSQHDGAGHVLRDLCKDEAIQRSKT